ncbi:MAG: ABC transporter ATP-binding protein [Acidobacteriaceae bacterium]|nr:ABC transporter ATP-binding protein [Acidobacteriaceae bacterium]MBV9225691.1 ABC transporter ATP-binding protein [Acidobacteriaceae bacterium]MBV9307802.1 ABC transporter ATP-binding protein [Acidobacteriaceae bacterium]MBV9676868.1 ABC transporter ATP-binding protein [Acidobacteriaceae bacterium]MBV9938057.1 ABC transporter ATP-binding protein [Acidobacteriaceae bacterium]
MPTEFAIETDALRKVYRSRFRGREIPAVSNLSLRVPQGIKYGLLGPNGAGKTTFVKMLLAAVHPTSGTAKLFGKDARDPEARRPIGYLPENHRFPTYFSGAGMLDFYAALSGVPAHERRRRVPEMLKLVGLEQWGDVRIKKYSKGMLQRLGLAQALMHRPRLLILDEPTDGVDPVGRRDIREILNGLTGTGVTVFINSHLLGEVESFCEYVAILHKGKLALEGKVSSLIAGRGYTVEATQVPNAAVAEMRRLGAAIAMTTDGLSVQVGSLEEANHLIDVIRAGGGLIESVSNSASSLEDVFIRTTRGEKAA